MYIIGSSSCIFVKWNIVAMYEIYEFRFIESLKELAFRFRYCVPAHLRNFVLMMEWGESFYFCIEYAKTVRVVFL